MGRNRNRRKTRHSLQKKNKNKTIKSLLLKDIVSIKNTTCSGQKYKVSSESRKIYNNVYRLKLKGYRVQVSKKTIYSYDEAVMETTQAKNLIKLGFVVQLEIK